MNLAGEDYYKAEEAGEWFGKGAAELGLSGQVTSESFRNLLHGYDPGGMAPLVQNAGKPSRQEGWDLTFSAPKDVSVFWALSEKAVRNEIHGAQKWAVERALRKIEETAGSTRRGKGGRKKEKTKLIFARFEHFTSRAQDPQIHTHAVLINLSLRKDRTTGSIQSRDVFREKMRAGHLYREELAKELKKRLGLEVLQKEIGFGLPIVPTELSKAFSKRRQAIVRAMAERTEKGAVAAKHAALRTRKKKEDISHADLFSMWKKVGDEFGFKNSIHLEPKKSTGQEKSDGKNPEAKSVPRIEPWDGKRNWNYDSNSTDLESNAASPHAPGKQRNSFIRIESRFLFPHAPPWSPASKMKMPGILFGFPPVKVWGKVRSQKNLIFADPILQDRKLFPNAPKWSPASKMTLPVFRLKPKSLIQKWLPGFHAKKNRGASRRSESTRQNHTKLKENSKAQTHSQ